MYQFNPTEKALLERSPIPQAIYQFIGGRVVTLLLSEGFLRLFGLADRAQAYALMNMDMYRDVHPDDAARIADAGYHFAVEGAKRVGLHGYPRPRGARRYRGREAPGRGLVHRRGPLFRKQ